MTRELRTLGPYLRAHRGAYATGLVCVVLSNLLNTLAPQFLQQGIDALSRSQPAAAIRRAALLLVGAALVGGTLRYLMRAVHAPPRRVL